MFKISFASYILILCASPYVTAQAWADFSVFIFIIVIIYHLLYIFVFRKKENLSLAKAIANYFLYLSNLFITILISYYIYIFYMGNYRCFFQCTGPYYGFEAWDNFGIIIFYTPLLCILLTYSFCYYWINNKINIKRGILPTEKELKDKKKRRIIIMFLVILAIIILFISNHFLPH